MLELDKANFKIKNTRQEVLRCPYPFQINAMNALDKIKAKNETGFSTMLVLPTGAGKTYTAVHWILKKYVNQGEKVLWIAHRSELLRQAAETFCMDTTAETIPDKTQYVSCVVSSEFGRSKDIKGADVVIASRQSIISGANIKFYTDWVRGREKVADRRLLVVLNEAHHAVCQSYRKIIKEMKRFVPNLDFKRITKFDLTSLNEKNLERITKNAERNKLIVDTYISKKEYYGKTIVFAIDVTNAIALNAMFVSCGVKSDYVVSGLVTGPNNAHSVNRNSEVIDAFRKNKLDVIINVNILTEGTDIPDVSFVSPKFLLEGDDNVPQCESEAKKRIIEYINTVAIEKTAIDIYESTPMIFANVNNIYPYGIIECSQVCFG